MIQELGHWNIVFLLRPHPGKKPIGCRAEQHGIRLRDSGDDLFTHLFVQVLEAPTLWKFHHAVQRYEQPCRYFSHVASPLSWWMRWKRSIRLAVPSGHSKMEFLSIFTMGRRRSAANLLPFNFRKGWRS